MEFTDVHKEIRNAVTRSQHCQRNWDLTQTIPEEDLNLILHAATQCPSKQNNAYYKVYAITNREMIEKIHDTTKGFTVSYNPLQHTTNSQTLANLLLVYVDEPLDREKFNRNEQYVDMHSVDQIAASKAERTLNNDKKIALGISVGYVNLASSLLGYSTGCCSCFMGGDVQEVLGIKNDVLLLMGVGFKDPKRNRREHHNLDYTFPTFKKSDIEVNIIT